MPTTTPWMSNEQWIGEETEKEKAVVISLSSYKVPRKIQGSLQEHKSCKSTGGGRLTSRWSPITSRNLAKSMKLEGCYLSLQPQSCQMVYLIITH